MNAPLSAASIHAISLVPKALATGAQKPVSPAPNAPAVKAAQMAAQAAPKSNTPLIVGGVGAAGLLAALLFL